jgi:cytochrome c-type biogenesis protein CcmH/NrfG
MRKDSLIFALSGIFFGLLLGWIIGSQQAGPSVSIAPQAQPQAQTRAPAGQSGTAPAVLDEARVRALTSAAEQRPQDAAVRVDLGNAYFDAERFADAIKWYEDALRVDPKNVSASTDLAVSYYYTNQPDRAIEQFQKSLAVDPRHTKTLLNMGIVRAFGKQDLQGAAQAWEQVIAIAPDSNEGRAAKQALDSMKGAHPEVGGAPAAPVQGAPGTN